LYIAFSLLVVTATVVSLHLITESFQVAGAPGRVALLIGPAAIAGCAALVLFGYAVTVLIYLTVGVFLSAQVLFALTVPDPAALPEVWWAWQLMVPVGVLIAGTLPTSRAIPTLAVVATSIAVLRLSPVSGPGHGLPSAVNDVALFLLIATLAAVAVPAWRVTAQAADDAASARAEAHARTERARAADRQRRAAARLLHDEVIHALRAVSLPVGAIQPAVVRRMAQQAGDLLADRPDPASTRSGGGLVAELTQLADRSPLTVQIVPSGAPDLPGAVVSAIAGATAEALRNVERHAGTRAALITVRALTNGVEVQIVDTGKGFDPAASSALLGRRESILGRLHDVGGTAVIRSAPGAGTTVGLAWSMSTLPENQVKGSGRLADLAGTRVRMISGCALPCMALTVSLAVLNQHRLDEPVPALTAVAVMAAVVVGSVLWIRQHPISGALSFFLIITSLVATIVGGWYLTAGGAVELAYFAAGAGAPALALVAFCRPQWESIVGVLAVTAGAAAMVVRMDPDPAVIARSLPAIASNLLAVTAVLAVRWTTDRMSNAVLWNEEMERQAGSAGAQLAVGRQVLADRLSRVREWVMPLLNLVAAGRFDPADPAVKRQAAVLEAAVRDDIRLGTAIDDRARGLIARSRSGGHHVEINADAPAAARLPTGVMSRLLVAALDGQRSPDRTVLTVSGGVSGTLTLSMFVTPVPPDSALPAIVDEVGGTVISGPAFLLVRLTIAPAASPIVGTSADAEVQVGSPA